MVTFNTTANTTVGKITQNLLRTRYGWNMNKNRFVKDGNTYYVRDATITTNFPFSSGYHEGIRITDLSFPGLQPKKTNISVNLDPTQDGTKVTYECGIEIVEGKKRIEVTVPEYPDLNETRETPIKESPSGYTGEVLSTLPEREKLASTSRRKDKIEIDNPDYNPKKPESSSNPKKIKKTITLVTKVYKIVKKKYVKVELTEDAFPDFSNTPYGKRFTDYIEESDYPPAENKPLVTLTTVAENNGEYKEATKSYSPAPWTGGNVEGGVFGVTSYDRETFSNFYNTLSEESIARFNTRVYLPRIYFKYKFEWIEKGDRDYKEQNKYTKRLNLPYRTLLKNVKKSITGEDEEDAEKRKEKRESDKKLVNVYALFGANIKSGNVLTNQYIFHFLETLLWGIQSGTGAAGTNKVYVHSSNRSTYNSTTTQLPSHSVGLTTISNNDKILDETLVFAGITYIVDSSYYQAKGTYSRGSTSSLPSVSGVTTLESGGDYSPSEKSKSFLGFGSTLSTNISSTYFRYQKEDNLCITIYINGFSRTIDVHNGRKFKSHSAKKDRSKIEVIPVDYRIVDKAFKKFQDKEAFIYESLYLEAASYVETKVSFWSTILGKILIFIGVALLSAIFAPGGFSLAAFLTSVVTSVVVNLALNFLAQILPPEVLQFLGIALAVLGGIGALGNLLGGMAGNLGRAFNILKMNANTLMGLGNKLVGLGAEKEIMQIKAKMQDLKNKAIEMQEKIDSLTPARIFADYTTNKIYNHMIMAGDTPDKFLRRSMYFLDVKDTATDYITNSTEYILMPPTPEEVLEDIRTARNKYRNNTRKA